MPRRSILSAAVAAILYVALALFSVRAIVPAPATAFPFPVSVEKAWIPIHQADQKMVAATIAHNARMWASGLWRLWQSGQCYPTPNAVTLGEHMLGNGLLGVVPYLVTRDPIVTYNSVVLLTPVIAALAMYALVYWWTGSGAAALVAGLLFGFHPTRIENPVHPFVVGNQWTPLALLFADRLMLRNRWSDVAGLVVFLSLQLLESLYTVLALAIIGGTYAVYLVLRVPRRVQSLAPKLAVVAIATGAVTAMVFFPYLATRATWGTLSGRESLRFTLGDFWIGGSSYPGSVALLLVLVALLDLLRRARDQRGYDPRLAYVVAGLLVMWCAVNAFTIPVVQVHVPSLFDVASRVVPGLDAIRGGGAVRSGVYVASAYLAGCGAAVLVENRRAVSQAAITLLVVGAAIVEVFYSSAARWSFGSSVDMVPVQVKPPAALLALYEKMPDGAVFDVPLYIEGLPIVAMADDVFLGAFHRHPVAACYNSFTLPIQQEMRRIAERLPRDARAADALYALGFRSVVVHRTRAFQRWSGPTSIPRPAPPYLHPIAEAHADGTYELYGLSAATPIIASFDALAAAPAAAAASEALPAEPAAAAAVSPPEPVVVSPSDEINVVFVNRTSSIYRHPDPIVPTRLIARWLDDSGAPVAEHDVTTLLPLALAAGEERTITVRMPIPSVPRLYRVTLAPSEKPDLVIASATVRVRPAGTPGADAR